MPVKMARVALRLMAVAAVLSAQAFEAPAARHVQNYHQQRRPLARPGGGRGAWGMVSSVPRTAATGGASPDDPKGQRKYFGVPAVPKKARKANGKAKGARTATMAAKGGATFESEAASAAAAVASAADVKTADEMAKLQAELKATQAKLEAAQKAMSSLLVKEHEAKLSAIEMATAPLKAELAESTAANAEMRKDLTELSAQFREYIGKSADDKKSTVGGFNQELERMRAEAETKDEKVQEYEVALRDYMLKSSEQRLKDMERIREEAADESNKAQAESAATVAKLEKELEEIRHLRDEYIKEREQELKDLGDW